MAPAHFFNCFTTDIPGLFLYTDVICTCRWLWSGKCFKSRNLFLQTWLFTCVNKQALYSDLNILIWSLQLSPGSVVLSHSQTNFLLHPNQANKQGRGGPVLSDHSAEMWQPYPPFKSTSRYKSLWQECSSTLSHHPHRTRGPPFVSQILSPRKDQSTLHQ